MHYLANFQPDGDGYLVTFPAVPEAITGGDTETEATANAIDALEVVLLTYAKDGRELPVNATRKARGNFRRIPVSAAVAAKLAFIGAFRESGMSRVALGVQLGKAEGEVRRMLDPYHSTKLATIEAGLLVLGKRLVVSVEAA